MEMNEQPESRVSLEDEFADIISTINVEGGVITEKATDTRQYKYHIDNAHMFKQRLEHLGAVPSPEGPVDQTDYYFLYPGEAPRTDSDTLCWREEKGFVDYMKSGSAVVRDVGRLIIKTDPRGTDPNPSRLVRYATTEDEDTQLRIIEQIHTIRNGNDFAPYRVSKKKTTYILPLQNDSSVIIDLDEQVELTEDAENNNPYFVGDFLKLKIPKNQPELAEKLQELLGVTGDSFDVPYIAQDAFMRRLYTTRPNSIEIDPNDPEELWSASIHRPYYYDAVKDVFVVGLDSDKLKAFDSHDKKEIQDEVLTICADLDASDGGNNLPSRSSGKGGGSTTYERLTGHDGFLKHPSIRVAFDSTTLWRKRWQPSDRRIAFSRVEFNDEPHSTGIFIHFVGSHDGYDRWLRQHREI